MEVGQAVLALDLVDPELDLAERVVLILLEIGEGDLEDTALEGVVGVLQTGGAVDEGLADTAAVLAILLPSHSGHRWHLGFSLAGVVSMVIGGRLTLGR